MSFCYFRALDMAPTYAVPGLLKLGLSSACYLRFGASINWGLQKLMYGNKVIETVPKQEELFSNFIQMMDALCRYKSFTSRIPEIYVVCKILAFVQLFLLSEVQMLDGLPVVQSVMRGCIVEKTRTIASRFSSFIAHLFSVSHNNLLTYPKDFKFSSFGLCHDVALRPFVLASVSSLFWLFVVLFAL